MKSLLNGQNHDGRKLSTASTSSCARSLDFPGSLPFQTKGRSFLGVSFSVALPAQPHHHLTPHSTRQRARSPSQGTSLGSPCSSPRPRALPCSAAVTWLFSRSLSAAPASPPQSNDAIAAVSALAPGTCCHPRAGQRRLGSVANGQAPGPASASRPPVARRSAQARARRGAGGGREVRGAAVRDTRELSVWPAGQPHSREKVGTEAVHTPRCRLSCGYLSRQPLLGITRCEIAQRRDRWA